MLSAYLRVPLRLRGRCANKNNNRRGAEDRRDCAELKPATTTKAHVSSLLLPCATIFCQLMKNIYLAGAVRTTIGRFGGTLASWTAADIGVAVAKESLRRAGVAADQITDSIWGCARQAGGGPNVARQITYRAGVPETIPAATINQACGSGLKAIILAAQEIMLGRGDAVLAG